MLKKYKSLLTLVFLIFVMNGCRRPDGYSLEKEGFLEVMTQASELITMESNLNILSFSCELDKYGHVQTMSLQINAYDEELEYICKYYVDYVDEPEEEEEDEAENEEVNPDFIPDEEIEDLEQGLSVQKYNADPADIIVWSYNRNLEPEHIDEQIRRIPIEKQASMLRYKPSYLNFLGRRKLEEGQPILDGAGGREYPILKHKEYQRGEGGTSDGSTSLVFELSDTAFPDSGHENRVYYVAEASDEKAMVGEPDVMMEYDYYINQNQICFSRDYGETWIPVDIPEDAMAETLQFYQMGDQIPEYSFTLGNSHETIAFFYGETATLRISHDNGKSWSDVSFGNDFVDMPSPSLRIVHFFNDKEGYAALGTEHSMGTGQARYCYKTMDGGITWNKYDLPLDQSFEILTGISFSDLEHGIVSLKGGHDMEGYPLLFYTEDGGATWNDISENFPWEELPELVDYIPRIAALIYENGAYTAILRDVRDRVSFTSTSLSEPWEYVDYWLENSHIWG